MLHRDYFMRQMEQAIRLLQVALGLIKWQNYPEALKMIDDGFQMFFGFDSKFNASQHFARAKWLSHVIHCAKSQTFLLIFILI